MWLYRHGKTCAQRVMSKFHIKDQDYFDIDQP